MGFLNPFFLAGLAALSIPVLVHLVHSKRSQRTPFPSLMFLHQTTFRANRRRRLRDLPLFLLRLAAFLLLVLAFARPYRRDTAVAAPGETAGDLVVLLDRSWSMRYGDRWERGVREARDAINSVATGDRASLVLFDEGAETLSEMTEDRTGVLSLLAGLEPGWSGTRFRPAFEAAERLLLESGGRGRVVLISDLQTQGWTPGEEPVLSSGITLEAVDLSESPSPNAGVASVTVRRAGGTEASAVITARLYNRSPSSFRRLEVTLEAGRATQTRRVDIGAGGTMGVTFDVVSVPAEGLSGQVRIPGDALTADDIFWFHIPADPPVPIRLIQSAQAAERHGYYMSEVLGVMDAPRAAVTGGRSASSSVPASVQAAGMVLLSDPGPVTGALETALRRYVESGGGVLVVLGPSGGPGDPQRRTDPSASLLPPATGAPVDRMDAAAVSLTSIEYDHPVFEIFRAPGSGAFTASRFFRYVPVSEEWADRVIARFDDGGPALLEKRVGEGRILVWTSTMDVLWNDLVLQPVYLPMMNRLVRYLVGYAPAPLWYDVGMVPAGAGRAPTEPGVTVLPASAEETGGASGAGAGRSAEEITVAVNAPRQEADLASIPVEEITLSAVRPRIELAAGSSAKRASASGERQDSNLWWYLMAAVGVMLAVESLVGFTTVQRRSQARGVT